MDMTYGHLTKALNTQEMIVEAMRRAILRGNLKSNQPLRDEIYLMRIALERMTLEHAIPKLTKSDLARAQSLLMVIDAEDEPTKWGELNWEFDMIQILHRNVARYLVEHHAILEACREQDVKRAVNLLRGHLDESRQNLVKFIAKL
jgi:DNA-binding GntR family transcriptional regulator